MSHETMFSLFNGLSLGSWVVLAAAPKSKLTQVAIRSGGVSLLFSALYAALIFGSGELDLGGFSSLAGVTALFAHPLVLLGGWVHYLAFDLLVGIWITKDAEEIGLSRAWVIPILFATFMLGPVGYLLYRAAKCIKAGGARS